LPAFPTGYVTRIDHGCDLSMKKISECMPKQATRDLFPRGLAFFGRAPLRNRRDYAGERSPWINVARSDGDKG
jgi:hypothetical protein